MQILEVNDLPLPGLKTIKFSKFKDKRGYFCETFRLEDIKILKGFDDFVITQSNESYSKRNTVRGLHFQWNPKMGKLVRTINGHMVDIALDIRSNSPTFGKVFFFDMQIGYDDDFGQWIWLPPGFAHGNFFLDDTLIEYYCTGRYSQDSERGISPLSNDLDFSLVNKDLLSSFETIVKNGALISDKDKAGLSLSDWQKDPNFSQFTYR